jgi:hypothetical protein
VPGAAALATDGTASEGGFATAISCTSPGDCGAVGSYTVRDPKTGITTSWPMVVSQTAGAWGQAAGLPGIADLSSGLGGKLTKISCASAGNCSALGSDSSTLFILDEINGNWGAPLAVPGLASLGAASDGEVDSLSCPETGDCTAIGTVVASGGGQAAFMVTEMGGTWGGATLVPGVAALSTVGSWGAFVSCPAAGNCTAIGGYEPTRLDWLVWVADEVNGSWGSAQQLAALSPQPPFVG